MASRWRLRRLCEAASGLVVLLLLIQLDHFPAVRGDGGTPRLDGNPGRDQPYAAVAQQGLHAARVVRVDVVHVLLGGNQPGLRRLVVLVAVTADVLAGAQPPLAVGVIPGRAGVVAVVADVA